MHKTFYRVIAVVGMICCLCTNVGAAKGESVEVAYDSTAVEMAVITRATGSFNFSVSPYAKAQGDTEFPMESGETVRIYATYSPDDVKMDFGLVDPDGVFHYLSTEDGTFDTTFEIPERGRYKLGIKNNSGETVKVSGFVKY